MKTVDLFKQSAETVNPFCQWLVRLALLLLTTTPTQAVELNHQFETANRHYENGDYNKAAQAYMELIDKGHATANLYFNLGNAALKAGSLGKAIVAYCKARQLAPRDPQISQNLRYALARADQADSKVLATSRPLFIGLTLNEWTLITTASVWGLLGLLALREWQLIAEQKARGVLYATVALTVVLGGLLAWQLLWRAAPPVAVITQPKVNVHFGPLEASDSRYTLQDGTPVYVVGRKDDWLQVRLPDRRPGWLQASTIESVTPAP